MARQAYRPIRAEGGFGNMKIIDEKFGPNAKRFVFQCGMATITIIVLLFVLNVFRHTAIIASLGATLAPSRFNRESGIIEACSSKERVRPELAAPHQRGKFDPHVQFFLKANPRHSLGDELCCLAPLSRDNFTRAAWRVIQMSSHASRPVPQ